MKPLMQVLVELGPRVQTPEGSVLQEGIKEQAKEIVATQRDQSVTQHYSALGSFAEEKANALGLYKK